MHSILLPTLANQPFAGRANSAPCLSSKSSDHEAMRDAGKNSLLTQSVAGTVTGEGTVKLRNVGRATGAILELVSAYFGTAVTAILIRNLENWIARGQHWKVGGKCAGQEAKSRASLAS